MVSRCGELETWSTGAAKRGSAGSWRRGQQVRTWSTGAAKRGVRREAETWSTGADVVNRLRRNVESGGQTETWSTGATKRGQQVRRNVGSAGAARRGQQVRTWSGAAKRGVRRAAETWSAGAARRGQQVQKRGQPVRKTRSAGAENAVNRCVERGQQVRRNTVFANVLKVLRTLPDLPDLPDLSRKGEREESRWRRALPLTRHAATGFSSTPDFSSLNLSPASTIGGGGGLCPRSRHSPSARRPARSASGSTSFDGTAATGGRGVPHRSRRRRYVDTRAGAVRLPDAGGARFAVSVSSATSAIEESRS